MISPSLPMISTRTSKPARRFDLQRQGRAWVSLFLTMLLLAPMTVRAQETPAETARMEPNSAGYAPMMAAVQQVMELLDELAQHDAMDPFSAEMQGIADRLTLNTPATGVSQGLPEEDLLAMLRDTKEDLQQMADMLKGEDDLLRRLESVIGELERAIEGAGETDYHIRRDKPNRYVIRNERDRVTIRTENGEWWDEEDRWDRRAVGRAWKRERDERRRDWQDEKRSERRQEWHDTWRSGGLDSWGDGDVFGEWNSRWPYQTQATYRTIPSVRYNRVDGLFIGGSRSPLEWSGRDRGRIYGQGGYAFGRKAWQYRVGVETRMGSRQSNPNFDLKVGASHQRSTDTDDLWKASWGENTAAAFFFRNDFFNYYETEGWTGYVVSRLTRFAQLSAAYRSEAYSSLERTTNWSIFGSGNFRANPSVNEGTMNTMVLALEGGSVRDLTRRPRGAAFRLEAEIGQGLGGDFDFSRYLGDVRTYARLSHEAGLSLRLRGGFSEGTVPRQKAFTLGGVGTMRGYGQNQFVGTRMALANAELALYDPDILEWLLNNVTVLGLFDAGWTNLQAGSNAFSVQDVVASAGFGLALDDRRLRLEVSWPLRDVGTGLDPSLWLRYNPTF